MKATGYLTALCCCGLAALVFSGRAGAAAPAATRPDPAGERLTFLTLQLSSTEESIKAINTALKVAGYKAAAAENRAANAEKGNELMDRKGGAPVPWDQFYGRTARDFVAPAPAGDWSVTHKGPGPMLNPLNDPLRRPAQFDYLYRANREQAAKAKRQADALGRKVESLLARRRQLEAEQVSLWGTIALEMIGNREIASRPLYRFKLKPAGDTSADTARAEVLRAATLFLRTADVAAIHAADRISSDPARALQLLKDDIQPAESTLRDAVVAHQDAVAPAPAQARQVKDLLTVAKRMQLVCRNVTDAYRLALDGDTAGDEPRKQMFRGQLQESLLGLADATAELDEAVTTLAAAWDVRGESGVDAHYDLPAAPAARAAAPRAATPAATDTGSAPGHTEVAPKPLFDGRTLAGWEGDPKHWSVVDGAIRGSSTGKGAAYLFARGDYRNFVLEAEFKFLSGNSGIAFRAEPAPDFGLGAGYEADIYLPNAIGKLALNDRVVSRPDPALQKEAYKPREWNRYTIEANGDHVRLSVNGQLLTDTLPRDGASAGRIALQIFGPTEVSFRNLTIRELP